jgi:hypothetical protein
VYQVRTLSVAAVLALFASAATVVGFFLRIRRHLPASRGQRVASRVQLVVAVLWMIGAAAFAAWGARASDVVNIIYYWPPPLIRAASWATLMASVLTLGMILSLPAVWRRTPHEDGWSAWRKLRFSVVAMVFAAFGGLLALWGALQPWAAS